jgi:hypothetical protein
MTEPELLNLQKNGQFPDDHTKIKSHKFTEVLGTVDIQEIPLEGRKNIE